MTDEYDPVEMFSEDEVRSLSPKAKWKQEHLIKSVQLTDGSWQCWSIGGEVSIKDDEDDALEDLALQINIPFYKGNKL